MFCLDPGLATSDYWCGACFDSSLKEKLGKGDKGVAWCNGPTPKSDEEENIFTGKVIATEETEFEWENEDENGWDSKFYFEFNNETGAAFKSYTSSH